MLQRTPGSSISVWPLRGITYLFISQVCNADSRMNGLSLEVSRYNSTEFRPGPRECIRPSAPPELSTRKVLFEASWSVELDVYYPSQILVFRPVLHDGSMGETTVVAFIWGSSRIRSCEQCLTMIQKSISSVIMSISLYLERDG